jgi:hypothetical protein
MLRYSTLNAVAKCEIHGCNSRWRHQMAYGVTKDHEKVQHLCTYHAEKLLDLRQREAKKVNGPSNS